MRLYGILMVSQKERKDTPMKKIIAPIVITIIFILYFLLYFLLLIALLPNLLLKLLFAIVPLALCGVMLYVCIQRIQEIRSGKEDDLSQY